MTEKYALQKVQIRNTIPIEEAVKHYKNITKRKPRKVRETDNFYQFRYLPPTKFEPRSFRTKVVNDDIHLIYGKLKDTHHHLEGKGLFDYFTKAYDYVKNKVSDAFDYVKNAVSINDFSDKTQKNLKEYGEYPIIAIQIRRVPIAFALDLALQGISAGEWERLKEKYGFDKFFHLSMVVTLGGSYVGKGRGRKHKQLAIEKLEVVSVNENIEVSENMETQDVPIPAGKKFNINDMFKKAREKVGDTKFFSYSALGQNNCQDFIGLLLDVEGLYNEPEKQFVYQDISQLAQELPDTTKAVSQGITHLGALANKYLGIGGNRVSLNDLYHHSITGGSDIVIPKDEFVKEHKHLIGLLNKSDNPEMKKEAESQAKELELKGGAVPMNKKLYEKVKSIVYPRYKKPSAYRSGAVVKLYKEMGGKFKDNGGKKLARWFEEEWKDVGNQEYPVYRPTKRITKDTPLTVSEIDPTNLKEQVKEKQKIKGEHNLKPFKGKKVGGSEYESDSDTESSSDESDTDRVGGNKASGFIRAMMAKDSQNPAVKEAYNSKLEKQNEKRDKKREKGDKRVKEGDLKSDDINKKKFKTIDEEGFNVQRMSKSTHNLLNTKKILTADEAIQQFYDFLIANAPQHQPLEQDGINYRKTFDIEGQFKKWKESQGVEIREARKRKREEPQPDDDFFPSSIFELPEEPVKKKKLIRKKKPDVVVVPPAQVPAEEKKEDQKEEEDKKAVLGKFQSPKDKFEEEINKLVDFSVGHLHFNDFIGSLTDVDEPHNPFSSVYAYYYGIFLYYYVVKYKMPILDFGTTNYVSVPKDLNVRIKKSFTSQKALDEYKEKFERKNFFLYNYAGEVTDLAPDKNKQRVMIDEIKRHLEKGEKQLIFYISIGVKKSWHSNFVLIRAVDKKIYIVDPHGEQSVPEFKAQYVKQAKICEGIAKALGYELVSSGQSCPYIRGNVKLGFQAIECLLKRGYGFCGWWNSFIVELCCLKPDTPFETLYKEASDLMTAEPAKVFRVIVNYQYRIQQMIEEVGKKGGLKLDASVERHIMFDAVFNLMSDRLYALRQKRRELLGYAKK